MFDWEDVRHFVAFAAEKSLSAAARKLAVDHVTIARRIASLEKALDLALVDRRGRLYVLTRDGERIAALAVRMDEDAFALRRAAEALAPMPSREIVVSGPPALLAELIAPHLARLRDSRPDIHLRLIGEKRLASLSRREADIALRLSRPAEAGLVVRKLATIAFALYASPAYLAGRAAQDFAFIAYDDSMDEAPQQLWLKAIAGDRPFVLRASDLESQRAAARGGIGIAVLPTYSGDADPGLVRLAQTGRPVSRDLWLAVHADLRRVQTVRAVMDFIAGCLRKVG